MQFFLVDGHLLFPQFSTPLFQIYFIDRVEDIGWGLISREFSPISGNPPGPLAISRRGIEMIENDKKKLLLQLLLLKSGNLLFWT